MSDLGVYTNVKKIGYVRGDAFGYSKRSKLAVTIRTELRIDKKNHKVVLSIMGDIWQPRKHDIVAGGQIDKTLRELIEDGYFIPKVPMTIVRKLLDVWGEYHLNDAKPIPEEEKEEYKEFLRRWATKYGGFPPYEEIKRVFPKYGERWYYWKIPRQTLRWIIAKLLADTPEEAYVLTDKILREVMIMEMEEEENEGE